MPITVTPEQRATQLARERDLFADAIRDAAVRTGICRPDAAPTGPQLLQLADDLAIELEHLGAVTVAVAAKLRELGEEADGGLPSTRGDQLRALADQLESKTEAGKGATAPHCARCKDVGTVEEGDPEFCSGQLPCDHCNETQPTWPLEEWAAEEASNAAGQTPNA